MNQYQRRHFQHGRLAQATRRAPAALSALAAVLGAGSLLAQTPAVLSATSITAPTDCVALTQDSIARLACFDRWASSQMEDKTATALTPVTPESAALPLPLPLPSVSSSQEDEDAVITTADTKQNCKNPKFSEMSRFWELEDGSNCGTFGIRGYRPISLLWIDSNGVNTRPSSPSPGHTAAVSTPYRTSEMRIQLSIRTKVVEGILTQGEASLRDSLWFGYSQQSHWQLFSGDLSRPFRTTDHEPEITYIYPSSVRLVGGWRLRYTGLSLVHQSNGQPLPLSRSWNRAVLMAGMEKDNDYSVQLRLWKRLTESERDDDNPDISDKIGRAEMTALWNTNRGSTLGATWRHALKSGNGGSLRLEWLKSLGETSATDGHSGLRLHTQLFSGYGDSLVDYNRRRTVFSIGLSLVDW